MVYWLLQLVVVVQIVAKNYLEHMVVVDGNLIHLKTRLFVIFTRKMILHF